MIALGSAAVITAFIFVMWVTAVSGVFGTSNTVVATAPSDSAVSPLSAIGSNAASVYNGLLEQYNAMKNQFGSGSTNATASGVTVINNTENTSY